MALVAIAIVIYIGTRLALAAPAVINGPVMSLSPEYLLIYAAFSMSRMFAAYLLSILFTLLNGYFAADHNRAGQVMMPLLDVLQSVPILSFLPVVLLGLSAFLTQSIAEIASVVLMFTSQVWNLTSAWLRRTCEAAVRLIFHKLLLRWVCVNMPGSTEFWDMPGVLNFARLTHLRHMQI